MSSEEKGGAKILKFKITSRGIRNDLQEKKCEETMKNRTRDKVTALSSELSEFKVARKPTAPVTSNKRGPEVSLECQRGKLRKMERSVKLQCGSILKELMASQSGWIFNEPVDPVKWNIPDYFSIITCPMDLGTVKEKLERSLYFSPDEFAADVRLTFSNAMLYNPPGSDVHRFAKKLNDHFFRKWKLLNAKWKQANGAVDLERDCKDFKKALENDSQVSTQIGLNKAPMHINLSSSNSSMPLEEKRKLRFMLVELSAGKMMDNLRTVFDKFGLTGFNEEMLHSFIDSADDKTLSMLRREIKVSISRRAQPVEPVKAAQNVGSSARKSIQKGTENCRQTCAYTGFGQSVDSTGAKCLSCGNTSCHCHVQSASAQACLSDISSERSQEQGHCGDSKFDFEVRCPVSPQTSRLGPDSDGPGVVVNEEISPRLSTPTASAGSGEGWTSFNIQMSPKKALRAAMLKSRFADTIFRATHVGKSDPAQIQQERERLEREQLKEKARIEKEIKAAEAAMRMKVQAELKMQREREREAARLALQMVEKTVEINENLQIWKDLEMMCSPTGEETRWFGTSPGHFGNPLERLGLYVKNDYMEEDEDAILNGDNAVLDGEDGEILS